MYHHWFNNKKITTFYLVRHGESEANIRSDNGQEFSHVQEYGEYGAPLTEKGREQAKQLAKRLADIHFDAIYSSDLVRAKHTAEAIALERKLTVQTTNLIRERSFFEYLHKHPGKSRKQLEEEMQKELSELSEIGKFQYKHSEHMESAKEAASRLITFLREVAVAHPGQTILVGNHGNLIRNFLTHLGWAKFDELANAKDVENTGYVVVESDGVDFFVKETQGIRKSIDEKRLW